MLVRTQEVVMSNPECQVVVDTVDVIKIIYRLIRSLVGTVEAFDHLLARPEFFGNRIVVGKSNHPCDIELEFITEFSEELLGGVHDEPDVGPWHRRPLPSVTRAWNLLRQSR